MEGSATGGLHLVDGNGMGSDPGCQWKTRSWKCWQRGMARGPGTGDRDCGPDWVAMDSPGDNSSCNGRRVRTMEGLCTVVRCDTRAKEGGVVRKGLHQADGNSLKTRNETRWKEGLYPNERMEGDCW